MANSPKKRIRVHDVVVCIWENGAFVDGKVVNLPNITFDRTYSREGALKSTHSFRVKDLKDLKLAIEKAESYFKNEEKVFQIVNRI